ncbi:MAG: lipopolysaccharide heptosyltransferase II [Verrucomicrobiae bacterium]|nr:lipopolysaccharide heptosyltransferase II [Verrucomicrobiae bacterium]
MAERPPTSTAHPRRLLIRGVNWLGDAVMTTPALLRLREGFPEAHIALLAPLKLAELWQGHPALDEVLAVAPGENPLAVARRLRGRGFDTALVLPNSPRAALEMWLARIPQRVGYARPWRNWLLTHLVPTRPGHVTMRKRSVREIRQQVGRAGQSSSPVRTSSNGAARDASAHQIHEYLHLVGALGANPQPVAPLLCVADEEVAAVKARFGLEREPRPLLALNPGAEYGPAKRWPAERFTAAAREIQRRTGCVWLVLGGAAEAGLATEIATAIGAAAGAVVRNLAGQTSLRELMALLRIARVLLTNDTGPMHVAAALGRPVVALFGSTAPELTGPGLPGDSRHRILSARVPCAPCFRRTCPIDLRCMRRLEVETVVMAVSEVLRS